MSRKNKDLQKDINNMIEEINNMQTAEQKIEDLEKRICRLEFTMEMAYEDLNEVSHLMSFMEKHLEKENMQLSKCISLMHSTVSRAAIDLLEEL